MYLVTTAKIISGRETAEHILEKELSKKVDELKAKNIIPNLVVILVGEMKASASYVAQKEKFAAKAGIKSEVRRFTAEISEEEIHKDNYRYKIICNRNI